MALDAVRVALLCLSPAMALGAAPLTTPATPAGRALAGWLDANNSGDRAAIEAFSKVHVPWWSVDRHTTEERWTDPTVQGMKFTDKPVFIITAKRTFSAGEEFSFDLKNLNRAILIGESTGGGAHTVAPHRLDDHFFIRVPFGRMFNPITNADWEGTGVEPNVKVAASDALDGALKRAREATLPTPSR